MRKIYVQINTCIRLPLGLTVQIILSFDLSRMSVQTQLGVRLRILNSNCSSHNSKFVLSTEGFPVHEVVMQARTWHEASLGTDDKQWLFRFSSPLYSPLFMVLNNSNIILHTIFGFNSVFRATFQKPTRYINTYLMTSIPPCMECSSLS